MHRLGFASGVNKWSTFLHETDSVSSFSSLGSNDVVQMLVACTQHFMMQKVPFGAFVVTTLRNILRNVANLGPHVEPPQGVIMFLP